MAKSEAIPETVAQEAIRRLRDTLKEGGRRDLASSLVIEVKRRYLYVGGADHCPICRLRYTGSIDDWDLQMFKWSTERYDTGGAFPFFRGGTLDECIGIAVEAYGL